MYQKGLRLVIKLLLNIVFLYVLYNSIHGVISEEKATSNYVVESGFKLPSVTVCPTGQWPFGYQNLEQIFRLNPWISFRYNKELGDNET
jgi:hypothetical protein